ncbi:MAG: hypothetical protein QOD39_3495, partial [Mycobacterium sp.]|nr:hypothetical protein [Mycobacterium sp.]
MHSATRTAVLSAVAIAAALGLSGCIHTIEPPSATPVTLTPITSPPAPEVVPLPPPAALIDVMARLTDPNVPGADKLNLVQYSKPDDAAALDRFDKAVSDGGFRPLAFEANDLAYAEHGAGNVVSNFVIKTANPQAGDSGNFTFPMEFTLAETGWQLTRETADTLLE